MQDVRVFAIAGSPSERIANAAVAKSVTLEVDTVGAPELRSQLNRGRGRRCYETERENYEKWMRVTIPDLTTGLICTNRTGNGQRTGGSLGAHERHMKGCPSRPTVAN